MWRRVISLAAAGALAAFAVTKCERAIGSTRADDERTNVIHLLNRTTFGATPALVEEVLAIGRNAWIERQLSPDSIDTSALEAYLARRYPSLSMSTKELLEEYPDTRGEKPKPGKEPYRPLAEQAAAAIVRAQQSPAQLREVMVDFWFNHFNVFGAEPPIRYAIVPYIRDTLRPRAFGNFEDLLGATAESAAMMYYLDNYISMKDGYFFRGREGGINENYARELMELHTVGVDGGYDQQDIIEVAKCFTGWTITPPWLGRGIEYIYFAPFHQGGDKNVMGHRVSAGGRSEGLDVVSFLASHPSTSEYISRKLCERFIGDNPPASIRNRAAAKFADTNGDIRAVMRLILLSDEFYDREYRSTKTKTTYEYVVSALRATNADVGDPLVFVRGLFVMGQPLYLQRAPIGWPEQSSFWTTAGGLLNRFEFADRLVRDAIPGTTVNVEALGGGAAGNKLADNMLEAILAGEVSDDSRAAVRTAARDPSATASLVAAIVLASPEFNLQ